MSTATMRCCFCHSAVPIEEFGFTKSGRRKKACEPCCVLQGYSTKIGMQKPSARWANRELKRHLSTFWKSHKRSDHSRPEVKIESLRRMANVVVERKSSYGLVKADVPKFKQGRGGLHGQGWDRCWACRKGPGDCLHHIVQIQNGGVNSKRNMVRLCHDCHAAVHPWLVKTCHCGATFTNPAWRVCADCFACRKAV